MIRVLMVIGCMGLGGAETMIMNLYRNIDRTKVQFDFLVHNGLQGEYEDEILGLGGCIYRIDKYMVYNYFSYVKQLNAHFATHPEHKIVHCHIGSSAAVCLSVAKKYGAITIAHSHCARVTTVDWHSILWRLISYPTRFIADYCFACGKKAAVDRYGKSKAQSDHCRIILNGIDCERFKFSKANREIIRSKYNIEECYVVGNVGRHTQQKNPLFYLEIFSEIYKMDESVRLLQLGEGEMTKEMEEKCHELGIEKAVIFAGAHLDVEKYYSAMDVFLFPSLWEGLPVTLIEAQANGLQCVVSDTISREADMETGSYTIISLKSSAKEWAEKVLQYKHKVRKHDAVQYVSAKGYDVIKTAQEIEMFYLGYMNYELEN